MIFRRLRFHYYLFICFSVLTTVPVFFFAALETHRWEQVAKDQLNSKSSSFAVALATINEKDIELRVRAIEALAAQLGDTGLKDMNEVAHLLALYRPKFRMELIYIGNMEGTSILTEPALGPNGQVLAGRNYRDRDYYQQLVKTGKTAISAVLLGKVLKSPNIQVATPIRDRSGRMIGYVSGSIDLKEVQETAERVIHSTSGLRALVLDSNSKTIAQSNGSPLEIMHPLSNYKFFRPTSSPDVEIREGLDENGAEVLGAVATVGRGVFDWTVVTMASKGVIHEEAGKARIKGLTIISIGLLVSLIIALLLTRWLSSPISSLAQFVFRLGQGELNTQRPAIQPHHPTELHELLSSVTKMADQLSAHTLKLEETSRLKTEFLANMSHEIRTPINGVVGLSSLLADTPLRRDQVEYVSGIRRSADALLALINDILDLSKIEAGKLDFELIDFKLDEVIQDTLKALAFVAEAKGLFLRTSFARGVPAYVKGDPGRLRQILTNLVSNAVKFTENGGVEIRCSLVLSADSIVRLRFEVQDTGVGIPSESKTKLFRAFTQADGSTTRKFGGTGLGLSISKQLIEKMNGLIGVESEVGVGSTFWFEIDLSEGRAPIASDNKARGVQERFETPFRVLVAEDNPINSTIAVKMLQKLGLYADSVANGKEALDALMARPYELILMDCQMPEMDGYEATRRIRAMTNFSFHALPIVAMTANALKGDREVCLEAGMNDYVSKPVSIEELATVLGRWLPNPAHSKKSV